MFKQSFENKISFNFTEGETKKEVVFNPSDQHPKDSPLKISVTKKDS